MPPSNLVDGDETHSRRGRLTGLKEIHHDDALDITAGPLPEAEHQKQLRRALIASTVGTTIEWYDFLLYSTATGLVFGKLFFSEVRSPGRRAGSVRHLHSRIYRPADRRRDLRPLRRPHRPQGDADRDIAADRACHCGGRLSSPPMS